MDIQLDYFSRRLDMKYYDNALKIYAELKKMGQDPQVNVHTYELYDQSFSFPRVRRYELVQSHMDQLEHFQDNLNTNISNEVAMANFLRTASGVRSNLNTKYHNGEFDDPANHDPWEESL